MGPPFSDGVYPVGYTRTPGAVDGEQKASVKLPQFAAAELMYKNTPVLSESRYSSETSSPRPSSHRTTTVQKMMHSSTSHAYAAMAPCHSTTTKDQRGWPSPPLAPGDVDSNYCIQDSVFPCNDMVAGYSYMAVSSNGPWCSPVHHVDQPSQRYQAHCLPGHVQDLPHLYTPNPPADIGLDTTDGYLLALNSDNTEASTQLWGVNIVPSRDALETSPISQADVVVQSPASMDTPRDMTTTNNQEPRSVPSSASPPSDLTDSGGADKPDEPYAKLIYKAIMTRPGYSMTLQEIYQWFRDNTTKAVRETGGWQNSIRHNLSMNAAFRKRDKFIRKTSKNLSSTTEEPKRVNEWVLEEWAIRDGVQSTTRYRKGTYSKRGTPQGKPTPGWSAEHSEKRALSGRKGGCATRASRLRRQTSFGQTMAVPPSPRHLFELRPVSPAYPSVADMYGMRPVMSGHYESIGCYPSPVACQEDMAGSCGGDSSCEPQPQHPRAAIYTSQQQAMTNSSNMHHTHHTHTHTAPCDEPLVGQSFRTPAADVAPSLMELQRHGHGHGRGHGGIKCEGGEACESASPTCRPFQHLPENPYVWWNQHGL